MKHMLDAANRLVKHRKLNNVDNVEMNLQNRINELLKENPEKKATDIAKYVGVSRATVSAWVNGGTKTIAGSNAFKVAKLFNVNPEWVQDGKHPKRLVAIDKQEKQQTSTEAYAVTETKSPYTTLTASQEKIIQDIRQLLLKDIDPMDVVTLQQIVDMLARKYQEK